MQQHYENFLTTLYKFVQDLDRYKKTEGTEQALKVFNQLDMAKVIFRIYTLLKNANDKILSKDETLFNTPFEILPNVDVSLVWPGLAEGRKLKVFTYLSILQIESDILVNKDDKENKENNESKEKKPLEFDPYVGIGSNNPKEYCVADMYESLANMPEEDHSNSGPGLASIASLIGLDKMVNFEELSDQLKNMKPEDIENATNNIKEMLGNNMDEKTTSMLNTMLTDISIEMQTSNLNTGDPFKNIMGVAESVAGKMKPKIQSGELDLSRLVNSTQLFATQCKDKDGNPMFGEGNNPFAMLSQLASSLTGGANNANHQMTEKQMKDQCNKMLKSMNMGDDVEKLLQQTQTKPKPKNKNNNKKKNKNK